MVLELLLMVAQTLDEVDSKGSRTNQATAQVLGQLLEVGKEQLQGTLACYTDTALSSHFLHACMQKERPITS